MLVVLSLAGLVAMVGCREDPPEPAPSVAGSGPQTLHVTVNAGGDCSVAEHEFGVQALDPDGRGTRAVGGPMSEVTMLEPGIIPCRFTFTIPGVSGGRVYYLVDHTEGVGWGPWTRFALVNLDFKIEVSVTDLD